MYKHGVYIEEVSTNLRSPQKSATIPIVFGTAPSYLTDYDTSKPILCNSFDEAIRKVGYSDDWETFTLCEFMKCHYQLYALTPVIFINILDIKKHKVSKTANISLINKKAVIKENVIKESLAITGGEYTLCTDYLLNYNTSGYLEIVIPEESKIEDNTIDITYDIVDISKLTVDEIAASIKRINTVFPQCSVIPSLMLAPGFSHMPPVAQAMMDNSHGINGLFNAIIITDIPDTVNNYTDVGEWKKTNGFTGSNQIVCWPQVKYREKTYHLSTHLASLLCSLDIESDNVPILSPSNKSLCIDSAVTSEGEVNLGLPEANILNSSGIVTAINFIGGWKCWGNRPGAYSQNLSIDPKDAFITEKRMTYWLGTTLTKMFWGNIDEPGNKRLIDTVLDNANLWLNSLKASGYILGGRVEFRAEENSYDDLMDGNFKFHVYKASATPARNIDFIVEYSTEFAKELFT